jgi:hypothetical protein
LACRTPAAKDNTAHKRCRICCGVHDFRKRSFRRRMSVQSTRRICGVGNLLGCNHVRCACRKPFQPRFRLRHQA